jgi:hypothetical protein
LHPLSCLSLNQLDDGNVAQRLFTTTARPVRPAPLFFGPRLRSRIDVVEQLADEADRIDLVVVLSGG